MQLMKRALRILNTPVAIVVGVAAFFALWIVLKVALALAVVIGLVLLVAVGVLLEGAPTQEESLESEQSLVVRLGLEGVAKLRALGEKINDLTMQRKVLELASKLEKIVAEVKRDSNDAARTHEFLNEILESTITLVNKYVALSQVGSAHDSVNDSLDEVATTIDELLSVFEAQLASLVKNDSMDIKVEISVLKSNIANLGLQVEARPKKSVEEDAPVDENPRFAQRLMPPVAKKPAAKTDEWWDVTGGPDAQSDEYAQVYNGRPPMARKPRAMKMKAKIRG